MSILAAESIYFLNILSTSQKTKKADLIVVFQGREKRVRAAYDLVEAGFSNYLVVSPATQPQSNSYDRKYKPTEPFEKIIEDKARTTFENALHTRNIIKSNGFKSAILVTSWNHMPRSYLLLKTMLIGSNIKIQIHTVPTGHLNRTNWHHRIVGWKMVYNEIVEFWGSLLELAKHRISGKLPAKTPGKSGILGALRKWVLFDIKTEELN